MAKDALPEGMVWEDPPDTRAGASNRTAWTELLQPLLEHPGRWAKVREFTHVGNAYTLARRLRNGGTHRPPGRWEFAARKSEDVTGNNPPGALYARYLGPESENGRGTT